MPAPLRYVDAGDFGAIQRGFDEAGAAHFVDQRVDLSELRGIAFFYYDFLYDNQKIIAERA